MPSIGTASSVKRIASTAAWSALSFSPRPTQRAGGERGGLGHAHELEREVAVGMRGSRRSCAITLVGFGHGSEAAHGAADPGSERGRAVLR